MKAPETELLGPVCTCGKPAPPRRLCGECEGAFNRRRVDRLRDVIRELKESVINGIDADRERELVGLLKTYEHPNVTEFLGWLSKARERHAASYTPGRARSAGGRR